MTATDSSFESCSGSDKNEAYREDNSVVMHYDADNVRNLLEEGNYAVGTYNRTDGVVEAKNPDGIIPAVIETIVRKSDPDDSTLIQRSFDDLIPCESTTEMMLVEEVVPHDCDTTVFDTTGSQALSIENRLDSAKEKVLQKCNQVKETNDSVCDIDGKDSLLDSNEVKASELDLVKLCHLITETNSSAHDVEGKDILLFLGATGSGKTSSMLYLASVSFIQNDEGDYETRSFPGNHPELKEYKISGGSTSCTRCLQTTTVMFDGRPIVLCDTPGFGDTEGYEYDIASGISIIEATHRARSVVPILVFNKYLHHNRFSVLIETLQCVIRLIGRKETLDCSTFRFLITGCTKKDAQSILTKVQSLLRDIESPKHRHHSSLMIAMVKAMIIDLQSSFLHIELSKDGAPQLLSELFMNNRHAKVMNPGDLFVPFVSEQACNALNATLSSYMVELDNLYSNNMYSEAAPLIQQLIHVRCGIQMVEHEVSKAVNVEKMLQRLYECSRHHLFKFFNIGPNERCFFLAELEKLRRVNECVRLFHENRYEFSEYAKKLEKDLCSILKIEEVIDINTNASGWAWKMILLHELSTVASSFPHCISRQCNKAVDRIDLHLCQEIRNLDSQVRDSLLGLYDARQKLASVTLFSSKLIEFRYDEGTKYCFCEKLNDFWSHVKLKIEKLQFELNTVAEEIKNATKTRNYFKITLQMVVHGADLRRQLISSLRTKECNKMMFNDSGRIVAELLTKFDRCLISWLRHSLRALDSEVSRYDIRSNSDMDFAALEKTKVRTKERLQNLHHICSKAASWQLPENDEVNNVASSLVNIHAKFDLYIQDIDEHSKRLVENCHKAYNLASQFYNRLQNENEDISKLLEELDEPGSWDSWSSYEEEKNLGQWMKNGIKSWFGFSAENVKLSRKLKDIVNLLKKVARFRLTSLVSPGRLELSSLSLLAYLLRKRNKDISLVVTLLRLRDESSLRKELFDGTIRHVFSKCLSFLQYSFKIFVLLPKQLIENHYFDNAGELLSLWKDSSEIWMQLRSFANSPVKMEFDGVATELRHRIHDCLEYDSIVEIFFQEVKSIQLEVDKNSLNCHNVSVFEKNKYYERLERLLQSVHNFKKHKDHATSPSHDDLLNIEDCILAKFSSELEQMGTDLIKKMDKFPSDSVCVKSVKSLLSNLDAIENIFTKTSASLVKQACNIKASAKQNVETVFQSIMGGVDYDSPENVLEFLLLWKRSGYEVQTWKPLLDEKLDEFLDKIRNMTSNQSSLFFKVSLLLRSKKGGDAIAANLLLSEHSIFEGIINVIFDEKTAKQDITYVLGELSSLSDCQKGKIEALFAAFEDCYLDVLERGLALMCCAENCASDHAEGYFAAKAEELLTNFNVEYSYQVATLTAVIFAQWSLLTNVSFLQKTAVKDKKPYLKKPHPAQVVAIWLMLNMLQEDYLVIGNILVELKTGEGKSVVLGITATILALFGLQVDCACYSTFLSKRDYDDFYQLFECFGVRDQIQYGTISDFADDILSDQRRYAKLAIKGSLKKGSGSSASLRRILLIDEVDVFFGEDVLGRSRPNCVTISSQAIRDLFYSAWNSSKKLSNYKSLQSDSNILEAKQMVVESFPVESRNLIQTIISDLLYAAFYVKEEESSEFFVLGNLLVKKVFDGVNANYGGNVLCFRYLKCAERGDIPRDVAEQWLALAPIIGRLSYAELPLLYSAVIGVTGTLHGLGSSSAAFLKNKYAIDNYHYVASVFGKNRLAFFCNNPKDVVICPSEADFILELKQEIITRRRPLHCESGVVRPVMIFFRTKAALKVFYESAIMKNLKGETSIIDETMSKEIRYGLFQKATEQGSITLMIRDFGRGTDFKCHDPMLLDEGGVHVVQAFFSTDLSEEIQIKGRTSRQGANGSYSIVMNSVDLCDDLSLSDEEVQSMMKRGEIYASLDKARIKQMEEVISKRLADVERHEECHYQTLACTDALLRGRKGEVMSFLEEVNGIPTSGTSAFSSNKMKEEIKSQREAHLRSISEADRQRRFNKLAIYSDQEMMKLEMLRVRDAMKQENVNYYKVLGIPIKSSRYQILNTIRKLSKFFHPDKCQDTDAVAVMQLLNNIKTELCSDAPKRQRYDDELNQQSGGTDNL